MRALTTRSAYPSWLRIATTLRDVVDSMSEAHLALRPSPERWPLWATIGHTACQRVFWLCDFAGEPGADTTPYPNAGFDCPGDDDLEHVLTAEQLVVGLDASFRIVEACLDGWTMDMLADEVHPARDATRSQTRGWVIERVFAHDIAHCTELNETLGRAGLPQIDLWS